MSTDPLPPKGEAPLQRLVDDALAQAQGAPRREDTGDFTPPGHELPAITIERLRITAHRLREAESLVYRALNQNRLDEVPAAIAATKAALDQLTSIR